MDVAESYDDSEIEELVDEVEADPDDWALVWLLVGGTAVEPGVEAWTGAASH